MTENLRSGDDKLRKIAALIEAENDPKTRTLLITMQCIAEEVVNSRIGLSDTHARMSQQEQVLQKHARVVDRAMVLWNVGAWFGLFAQGAVVGAGAYLFNTTEKLKDDMTVVSSEQSYLKKTLDSHIAMDARVFEANIK